MSSSHEVVDRLEALARAPLNGHCKAEPPVAVLNALPTSDDGTIDLKETDGLYNVAFPVHQVRFQFDRLNDVRNTVSAELTITLGSIELLGETDVSLKSDASRDKIARTLIGFVPTIPWKRLLERACTAVFKHHRVGEPIVVLKGSAPAHVPFILNPFVYRQHQTLFFAPGGSLKSIFGLYLALTASHGATQNGLSAISCPVLYLDWELNEETVDGRLRGLRTGHPELAEFVPYYRRCELPLHQEAATIARFVAEHGIELLILDSAAMACGGDLNSPETVVKLTRALRTIGCSSVLLAHVSKTTPEGQERSAYGSVFFRELARNVWELERAGTDGPARVLFTHRKSNFGPLHQPLAFTVTFEGEAIQVSASDPQEEPAFEEKLPLASRIRMFLERDGGLYTCEDIAAGLNAKPGSVKTTLWRHQGQKWQKLGDSRETKWTVLAREQGAVTAR